MSGKRTFAVVMLIAALLPSYVAAQTAAPAAVAPRTFSWNSAAEPEAMLWPTTIWWWNGTLDPAVLGSQLADMKAHDIRNALMFPLSNDHRPNDYEMVPDYLAPGFFDRVQVAVDEAARQGMNCWLYDEAAWPAGSVLRHDPQYATQYAVYQLYYSNGSWLEGRNTSSYVNADFLSPQTTAKFIATTHQPYVDALGQEAFGSTIKFTFTDEPAYQYFNLDSSIPWTPGGGTLFQNKFGYDVLADHKLDAFRVTDVSQLTAAQKQVRVDVFDFVSGQYRDAFFLPKRDWARAQGIAQCGHLGGEDLTMGATIYGYGHVMRQLRTMDMPGVDTIWRQLFPGNKSENNFPKFASSVAHQNGTALSFTESYAVYGSGVTPAQMKWVLDYQFVRGINHLLSSNYPITTEDNAMTGERPRFGPVEPMWDYLPDFHRYAARLGYLMACGEPGIDVGLYYPVRDIWANGAPSDPAVQGFNSLSQSLLERQVDYDAIDDDILNDPATRIENGRLVLGAMSYKTVVVGPTQWMTPAAQQRIDAFAAAGGQVIRINNTSEINAAIAGIAPTVELSTPSTGIRAAERRWDGGGAMYLFNEGQTAYEGVATFDLAGKLYQFDPASGVTRAVNYDTLPDGRLSLPLGLAAGESMILVAQPPEDLPADVAPAEARKIVESVALADGWTARVDRQYVVGEHNFEIHESDNPQFQPVELGRWATTLGLTADFSGHVTYRRTVELPESMQGERLLLDLGGMEYAARVKVDGQEVGRVLWSPWTIELPQLGDSGEFVLDIEMSNTLANEVTSERVRDLWNSKAGQPGWPSPYNDRQWVFEMESRGGGLLGPVRLHRVIPGPPTITPSSSMWISPTGVPFHSPDYTAPGRGFAISTLYDSIYGPAAGGDNAAVMLDDTPSDPAATGCLIFDLGEAKEIDGVKLWSRNLSAENWNAFCKNVDVFYFADDEPGNNAIVDDIEGDADIVGIWSGELTYRASGDAEEAAFGSSVKKRYIGLRLNDTWDPTQTTGERSNQIQEVAFRLVIRPGDADLNGRVDSADAALLAANWLSGPNATWAQGDFNNDGAVNDLDAALMAANWTSSTTAGVSEPGTLVLLAGVLLPAALRILN